MVANSAPATKHPRFSRRFAYARAADQHVWVGGSSFVGRVCGVLLNSCIGQKGGAPGHGRCASGTTMVSPNRHRMPGLRCRPHPPPVAPYRGGDRETVTGAGVTGRGWDLGVSSLDGHIEGSACGVVRPALALPFAGTHGDQACRSRTTGVRAATDRPDCNFMCSRDGGGSSGSAASRVDDGCRRLHHVGGAGRPARTCGRSECP